MPLHSDLLSLNPTVLAWTRLRAWPVESQRRARRNAMIAATACAQRRAERQAVADYLDGQDRASGPAASDRAAQG